MFKDTTELTFDKRLETLSKREWQVTEKILQGLPNKSIANQLFISERTVKFHCANIYQKLQVRNRAYLMAHYFKKRFESGQSSVGSILH